MSESKTKFKLIEIQKFALYWDSDTSLVGDLPSKDLDVSNLRAYFVVLFRLNPTCYFRVIFVGCFTSCYWKAARNGWFLSE